VFREQSRARCGSVPIDASIGRLRESDLRCRPCGDSGANARGIADAWRTIMQTVQLNVSGMTCGGCVGHVTRALTAVPGVDHVDVSLADNTASVKFDERNASVETLRTALRSAGYDTAPTPMQREPGGGCCGG
jgi:copper chaperone